VPYFTFHEYSIGNGPKLDPRQLDKSFLNAVALDKSGLGAATLAKILHESGKRGQELWSGETAAANNGGQTGITDTYIDGFWYMDQLGAHAKYGVSVFQRQVRANYNPPTARGAAISSLLLLLLLLVVVVVVVVVMAMVVVLLRSPHPLLTYTTRIHSRIHCVPPPPQVLLSHGGYPMINETRSGALTPLPDYWLALVHKRTMGTGVLHANSSSPTVRVYAHCANTMAASSAAGTAGTAGTTVTNNIDSNETAVSASMRRRLDSSSSRKYPAGAVTLAILNIGTAAAPLVLDAALAASSREEFVLTAGKPLPTAVNPLQSAEVRLNGQETPLALKGVGTPSGPSLPQIDGKKVAGGTLLEMPPTSYGFIVFPEANAAACK
jgi:hypothetical protein